MELAYRLAVDESAYVKNIRDNVVTLITPVVEVDGTQSHGRCLQLARRESQRQLAAAGLLG